MNRNYQNYLLQKAFSNKKLKGRKHNLSFDVFGLVGSLDGGLGIGQNWDILSPQIEILSPMMYPSHYPRGYRKIKKPDAYPSKTIHHSIKETISRNNKLEKKAKIRPLIQCFTAIWLKDYMRYGKKEIKAQVDALKKNGIHEYLIWNPRSRYDYLLP